MRFTFGKNTMMSLMKSPKLTTIMVTISALIGWLCWEAGKNYGRNQESKVIDLARNMQAYETEWFALYHLSIFDYDEALLHQRQKLDKAFEKITNFETEGVDPNLKWYYVDRIVEQHPGKLNELPIFNEFRKERIKKEAEAEQAAPCNH
jgi:hypothetical protein